MKIAIIGTGKIGGTLVRKLSKLGHQVRMANSRGPASLSALAAETGAEAVNIHDVVHGVDFVIIALPEKSVADLPKTLFRDLPANAFVVDTGNYYPIRDGIIDEIENGVAESVWVSKQIGRPVLKAFNSIGSDALDKAGLPKGTPDRVALPIAGDDVAMKTVLSRVIDGLGFDPVDSGSLTESWRQQPGSPVYCTNLNKHQLVLSLAKADKKRLPERREAGLKKLMELGLNSSWQTQIQSSRSIYLRD